MSVRVRTILTSSLLLATLLVSTAALAPPTIAISEGYGDSMEPAMSEGDRHLCLDPELPGVSVERGDVVSFEHPVSENHIRHRVIKMDDDQIVTQGDNNSYTDAPITDEHVRCVIVTD